MNYRIRIEGIYDKKTIEILKNVQLHDFSFDFRPRSFNFLQQYRFIELITSKFNPLHRYFLHYANERDFIIEKMIFDLNKRLDDNPDYYGLHQHFVLEFSDRKDVKFYEQFQMPFYWHYSPNYNMSEILNSKYLQGIVLQYSFLRDLFEQSIFNNFAQNFHQWTYETIKRKQLELVLVLDWDSDLFPSFLEFFDFDLFSLPINRKVELSYRNVDYKKMEKELKHYQTLSI